MNYLSLSIIPVVLIAALDSDNSDREDPARI